MDVIIKCLNNKEIVEVQEWFFEKGVDYFILRDKKAMTFDKFPHYIIFGLDIVSDGFSLSHSEEHEFLKEGDFYKISYDAFLQIRNDILNISNNVYGDKVLFKRTIKMIKLGKIKK
jgi:hypothetical protein